jgi:hypothetical protein
MILSEHTSDVNGLVLKRDELLGSEKILKEKNAALDGQIKDLTGQITTLTDTVKKNSPEESKKYLETQLAQKDAEWKTQLDEVTAERDKYKGSHLKRLLNDAIGEGTKDLSFVDGLRDGFVARVMALNQFEPKDINGETHFLNQGMKEVKDAIKEFSLTSEGKAYLKNPSSGGGAPGSNPSAGSAQLNPWKQNNINLTKQAEIWKTNPAEAKRLMAEAGIQN